MDRRLIAAALTGDVQNLQQLFVENPLILHTPAFASAGNPLHVASAYGHIDFVKEIIRLKPDFAKEVNQDGFSPMHMASANGQIDVVRGLMKFDQKLCHLQGPERKTPLHFAAIKGRVDVVSEMLSAYGECAEDVSVQRETVLHLAVKNNQFEVVRALVDWIRDVKKENILNMKDKQGNTALHLATWKRECQAIELLLSHGANASGGLEVNATNHSGLTALDVLLSFPSEAGDREIEEIFWSAGAMRMRDLTLSPIRSPEPYGQTSVDNCISTEANLRQPNDLMEYFKFKNGRDSPGETRSALLVVAVLVATTTFQFGVNPPGGVWQEYYKPDRKNGTTSGKAYSAGQSILGSTDPVGFGIFIFFNSVGFSLSIEMIRILTTNFPLQLELCFFAMYVTYTNAVITIAPDGMSLFVTLTVAIMPAVIALAAYLLRQHRKRHTEHTMEP
ncbi:ankyrin repeat-containing protein BDA1-like [Citrus sinensis]|uniref:ankyrin repeat-containing protein BDA1-like n=1 Tax=Citrus sinensis TaxID=2711 RepID=UPI000763A94B|nr:ankyrin repeat-containing protein BDA1-like [Citrus sinensis]